MREPCFYSCYHPQSTVQYNILSRRKRERKQASNILIGERHDAGGCRLLFRTSGPGPPCPSLSTTMATQTKPQPTTPKKDTTASRNGLESTPNTKGTSAFAAADPQPRLKYATRSADHSSKVLMISEAYIRFEDILGQIVTYPIQRRT